MSRINYVERMLRLIPSLSEQSERKFKRAV